MAVSSSLAAFGAGYAAARDAGGSAAGTPHPPKSKDARLAPLLAEAERRFAGPALGTIRLGVLRAADYQDMAYAQRYLERLAPIAAIDKAQSDARLLEAVARQLALAMTYEDTIRVAALKIRASRFARIRAEVKLADGQLLDIAEYLHPRLQEIADTLPAALGRWLLRTPWARRAAERLFARGRIVKTTSLRGFLMLYAVAGLKRWRPRSLRFAAEQADIDAWLDLVRHVAEKDYGLAVELAEARGLVRGYGDTHARGRAKFAKLTALASGLAGRPDSAAAMQTLRMAALVEESEAALDQAIRQLPSAPPPNEVRTA
jgi:indolepyruvate ferredoxin oxidoreductase beta subunit